MRWLAWRVALRPLLREPGRALLTCAAVALGVASFLSIRLANRAAVASFEQFTRGVGRGADLILQGEAGPLREDLLERLRPVLDRAWTRPLLEGSFARGPQAEAFQLLGVDLVGLGEGGGAEAPPASSVDPEALGRAFFATLQDPQAVLIPRALARAEGLRIGDPLPGVVDDRAVTLRVAGLLPEPEGQPLPRTLLVMDLPAAQALLRRPGELDRLELGLRAGADTSETSGVPALESRVRALLQPGERLEAPEQRAESGRTMSAAFRFNLAVLSLIALAVGAYLLFQAFDAAVSRRRETWASLRALGLAPAGIQTLVLLEAGLLGLLGSALGIALGWGLAQGAVRAVSRTLAALYGPASADRAALAAPEALLALGLGFLTCLLAAWLPARRAAQLPPVQQLARGAEFHPVAWRPLAAGGALLLAAGLALAFGPTLPPGRAWHAYGGALLVLAGGSAMSLALLPLFGRAGRRAPWLLQLALRPLQRPTGRHAWATAALAVAVGMASGMGVMVRSFEHTVMAWIGTTLRADLYVAPAGATGAASRHRMGAETLQALTSDPAVAEVDPFQLRAILLRGQPTYLGAGDMAIHARRGTLVMAAGGDPAQVMADLAAPHELPRAVVSETFARRFGVRLGDRLELPAPGGPQPVLVRGVYADYGNERGSLIVDRKDFARLWGESRFASFAVFLKAGEDPEAVARRWGAAFPGLQVRANQGLRDQVATTFHQTFALTYALELIGLAVALAGLAQAVLGLALQRRGELLTLRSLGATPRELTLLLLGEGLLLGLAGLVGGIAMGLLLARILVQVLNPQVFGWTLQFAVDGPFLGLLAATTLLGAGLALLPAARWAARIPADRAVEEGGA